MGHRLQQFLTSGRIIDLGEFLRQIQVIPADDAILDKPFAGFGHLLVFLRRLQVEFPSPAWWKSVSVNVIAQLFSAQLMIFKARSGATYRDRAGGW